MLENFLSQIQEHITNAPLLAYAASYLAGVLVSFTPCVYPVIPITLAYIGGRSATRLQAFFLSLAYVAGMGMVYAALGLIAAMTGRIFGSISNHPATLFVIGNICLIVGLSMFDVFPMPTLSLGHPRKGSHGGLLGAFIVGAASGLIVGPCTAPVLGAVLVYVAREGNPVYGASLLFVFAMGIGTLLVLIGTFAGLLATLPKSGPWMNRIKHFFGVALILLAEYFLIQSGKRWL